MKYFHLFSYITFFFALSILTHELGHILTAKMLGYDQFEFYLWPGVQIYPRFGEKSPDQSFNSSIAKTIIIPKPVSNSSLDNLINNKFPKGNNLPTIKNAFNSNDFIKMERDRNIIGMMGSGLNLLISLICITSIYLFKPVKIIFRLLFAGSLFYYDIFTYTVFPYYLDVPHLLFFGGNRSEPLEALSNLGLNSSITAISILVLSVIYTFIIFCRKKKIVTSYQIN